MGASEEPVLEADNVGPNPQIANSSRVPILGEGFQESSPTLSNSIRSSDVGQDDTEKDPKTGKRRLFGFNKKKDDGKSKGKKKDEIQAESNPVDIRSTTIQAPQPRAPVPQLHSNHPYPSSSPPNRAIYSSSPRIVSPAGSQIFERDVQETTLPVPNSPAIPSHIQTENHIPSVLDASSEAITNRSLDPDTVEIVMTSSHHGAGEALTGVGGPEVAGGSWMEEFPSHFDKEDSASNYGSLDTTDVRRLSFISFADVVQSEHAEHSTGRDSMYLAGLTSLSSGHRSPSPMRSPVSSQGLGTSPPTSKSTSLKGVELSPTRPPKPLGSPTLSQVSAVTSGELTIETMSQALRKTGSGDLSGARSQPISPISPDGMSERLHGISMN